MTKPNAYDPFAWIYNKHWGDSFLPVAMPVLENLVLSRVPKNTRILDLCCGTGQLAQQLAEQGYRVTGIDGSAEMLRYTEENAPVVEFIHADVRYFRLPYKYRAVISVFDSLNHIMSIKELKSVFGCVYNVLRKGGLFMFDLNTKAGYEKEWGGNYNIIEDDHVCAHLSTYNTKRRIATFDATVFRLIDGDWYRNDFVLYQKCHSTARVKSALKSVGFMDIETYGFDWLAGLIPLNKDTRRAFFLCRKNQ